MKKIKVMIPIMIIAVPIFAYIIFYWYIPSRFAEYSDEGILLVLQMIMIVLYIAYFGIFGISIILSIWKYFKIKKTIDLS